MQTQQFLREICHMVISRFQFTSSIYKVNAIKEQMILSTSIVFETEATLVLLCRLYWTCQLQKVLQVRSDY